MSEFEFLRNVTLGQYLPGDSPLHRLDPRAKLVMGALFLGGVVASPSILALALALLIVMVGLVLARVPLGYAARGLRPAAPFLLFLALLQVFTIPQNDTGVLLWQWWRLQVTSTDLYVAALTILRFAVLVLGLTLISLTTNTTQIAHGVEHLLRPLQRLGFPGHELALTVVIALRFVPLLALEAERIAKAQASRGADFGRGRGSPLKRARRLLPLIVPLFITALRRSEALVLAMEARCYTGGRGRTHLVRLRARWQDLVAVALVLLLTALLVITVRISPEAYLERLW